jgi:hypothetical protein
MYTPVGRPESRIGLLSSGISGDELTAAGVAEVYPGPG